MKEDEALVHLELRKKLEIRTWFLRISIGMNVAGSAGLIVYAVTRICG